MWLPILPRLPVHIPAFLGDFLRLPWAPPLCGAATPRPHTPRTQLPPIPPLWLCRSLHTAEDAVDTKWVTQQWVARGLAGAAVDPIAAALSGGLPLGGAAAAQQAQRVQKPAALRREAAEDGPSAAELALRAAKRGKAKKAGGKGKQGGGGKGFGG